MNILYIDAHSPFELQKNGSTQRSHLLVEALAQFAHVDVVVLRPGPESDVTNADVIFSQWGDTYYEEVRSWKMKRLMKPWKVESFFPAMEINKKILYPIIDKGNYDYIVVRYLDVALQCGLLKYKDRLIVDVDDNPVDVQKTWAKKAKSLRARLYRNLVAILMQHPTACAIKQLKYTFFSNPCQAIYPNSVALPNIPYYECEQLPAPKKHNCRLLFVGDLRYEPNYLGAIHFVKNVLPQIVAQVPDVELHAVGKCHHLFTKAMEREEKVVVKGFVEDLTAEYRDAALCVIPVYSGAGTNIKVLEALQMGRACVTTVSASKGFHDMLTDGRDLLMAQDDETFANNVVTLLQDDIKRNQLANNGRMAVEKVASRKSFYQIVKKSFGQML